VGERKYERKIGKDRHARRRKSNGEGVERAGVREPVGGVSAKKRNKLPRKKGNNRDETTRLTPYLGKAIAHSIF